MLVNVNVWCVKWLLYTAYSCFLVWYVMLSCAVLCCAMDHFVARYLYYTNWYRFYLRRKLFFSSSQIYLYKFINLDVCVHFSSSKEDFVFATHAFACFSFHGFFFLLLYSLFYQKDTRLSLVHIKYIPNAVCGDCLWLLLLFFLLLLVLGSTHSTF